MTLERAEQPPAPDPREAAARSVAHRRQSRGERLLNAAAIVAGLGFGATIGLAISTESWRALSAPGGWNTAIGRIAGFAGAYLMLVMVVLMARIPPLERAVDKTVWRDGTGGSVDGRSC